MEKRKLIWENKSETIAFEKDVISTAERCNSLLEIFESFQEWKKITTHSEWLELVGDPGEYFDEVLLANVNMSAGGRKPDPETAAKLFGIDRDNYLNMVAGKRIVESECKPCQKLKIRKGTSAISLYQYQSNQDYLTFDSGRFYLNADAIEQKKEGFKIFLETEKQAEYYNHFVNLAKILNEHISINKLGGVQIEQLRSMTGLLLLNGKLILNDMKLSETLKYLKDESIYS